MPLELNFLQPLKYKKSVSKVSKYIPELLGCMPISASLYAQIMFLPSIIHQLNRLNVMWEFLEQLPFPVLPPLDFVKTQEFTHDWADRCGSSHLAGPLAVEEKKGDFILPGEILQAFTPKGANARYDLERLEFLGDSFLKFSTGEALFCHFPRHHEGKLTTQRMLLIMYDIQ